MTIQEIIQKNKTSGGHFFDEATMKCWRSRISEETYTLRNGDVLFITSEKPDREMRHYTIRRFRAATYSVISELGFHHFKNLNTAKYQAQRRAREK